MAPNGNCIVDERADALGWTVDNKLEQIVAERLVDGRLADGVAGAAVTLP